MKYSPFPFCALLLALFLAPPLSAQQQLSFPSDSAHNSVSAAVAASSATPQASEKKVTAYTLPPDVYRKAHRLSRIYFWGLLVAFLWSVAALLLFLKLRLGPKYRDMAERTTSTRFFQAAIFAPSFLFTLAVMNFPIDIAAEHILRKYGISIESWGTWLLDWTKGQLISFVVGIILVWILYAVIRSSPRRWWFYFWLVSIPLGVVFIFLTPLVIDPLFHKFEPLAQKAPALTVSLERMVQRAGREIPPERMFWMGAGEKTTSLNAYVTGIGASKRVVVWDTTIAKMTTPQIVFVAGHEMGHYVLNHIPKGLTFFAGLLFVFFYMGHRFVAWTISRWGSGWGIRSLDDWASLPVLLLLLTVLLYLASPVISAVSRHFEHQADQYGLEVTRGLTPDSAQVAAQAFQILGAVDLEDPDPYPADIFMYYDHPPVRDRVRFALAYDPWSKGEQPEFVK
jgi:STE24 endopeptidase